MGNEASLFSTKWKARVFPMAIPGLEAVVPGIALGSPITARVLF